MFKKNLEVLKTIWMFKKSGGSQKNLDVHREKSGEPDIHQNIGGFPKRKSGGSPKNPDVNIENPEVL